MSRTVTNALMFLLLTTLLAGCGLTQSVTDASAATARTLFFKQITSLHLDFSGRAAINADTTEMNGMSVPTLVRVYQLRDNKVVDRATYDLLLSEDNSLLSSDLLDTRALVVKPGEGIQLNVPMDKDARFVSVVALFRQPDTELNTWRLTLSRDDLDPDRPRVIELGDNRLTLRPLSKD